MKIIDVLYYNYYLFYKKVVKESEPHATTNFVLSFSESLIINCILDFISIKRYCRGFGTWPMFLVTILIIGINYLIFQKSGRSRRIVKEKPNLWGSYVFSKAVSLSFFFITGSWLFWWPIYSRDILDRCRLTF